MASSEKKKVVFLDKGGFPKDQPLPNIKLDCDWEVFSTSTEEQTRDRLKQADVVLTNKAKISEYSLELASRLKLIVSTATGVDHIDLSAAGKRKITVSNTVQYGTQSIAEHTMMMILSLARNQRRYTSALQKGKWQESKHFCIFDFPITELAGKKIAIFGYGSVGRKVAKLAEAFSMQVMIAERKGERVIREGRDTFERALETADFLCLHMPLTDDSKHSFARKEFEKMKKSAFFINIARGAIVEQNALVAAIKQGEIAGAALDVIDGEPPTMPVDKHPLFELLGDENYNFLLSPHIAWGGEKSVYTVMEQCGENIEKYFAGTPIRVVE